MNLSHNLHRILSMDGFVKKGGEAYYHICVLRGSVRRVINGTTGKVEDEYHYYPFDGHFGECTSTAISQKKGMYVSSAHRFVGKEVVGAHAMSFLDFPARPYDAFLCQFWTDDPLREKYYAFEPRLYCGADPVNAIDPDGRKIIFINGYIGFGSPKGGETYWNGGNSSFVRGAKNYFNDKNVQFIDPEHKMLSTAQERQIKGYCYARENFTSLTSDMREEESIKLISHSMGGAFSEGIKQYLEEQDISVDYSIMLNTYQIDKIENNSSSATIYVDYKNTDDPVIKYLDDVKSTLKVSDIIIREPSMSKKFTYKHRSPIDNGDSFWKTILKEINDFLGTNIKKE